MKMNDKIINSIEKLEKYLRYQKFIGYDPYDALNSKRFRNINSKWIRILITQIFVYSPINLRNFFNIKGGYNPKALGLMLSSYCNLYKIGLIKQTLFNHVSSQLVNLLLNYSSNGYSGYCWGFNFDWQDINRNAKKWTPTIVVTSYIGNSFLDLFELTNNGKYLKIANSICNFILKDLNITTTSKGICFSYTPIDKHIVHNANCLGADFLSRMNKFRKDDELFNISHKAFNFSIAHQNTDGSWAYSIDPSTNKVRNQIDFHQGFILDSIINFIKNTRNSNNNYVQSLKRGAEFYISKQFNRNGRSKWRLPWNYPVDIHHQAQGIITFSKLYAMFKKEMFGEFAEKIAKWTITNMQDELGYFYYHKWPIFNNKIAYMRWGQAWMMFALSVYINCKKENKSNEKNH
jgi:hypothetical protein